MNDIRFIEKFEENVRLYPDKVILQDQEASLTFKELDELSGRVYAYLKEKGIGREDFVMISLKHGVMPYVAMIGVWKAGAAFVVAGEGLPQERQAFIYNDCHCKLMMDEQAWIELSQRAPLIGHKPTKVNDAAYAVYTSGSEGLPKGVVQEYGKLDYAQKTEPFGMVIEFPEDSIEYVPIPANFAGAVLALIWLLNRKVAIDAGPLSLMRNPKDLEAYFIDHKINIATLPPSFFKKNNISSPFLKYIQLSMETADNVYDGGYFIINSYAQSEGCIITMFKVDKVYNITPIGKPNNPGDVIILDDDNVEVNDGEIGELCYRNPYFRGYVNDEELTRKSQVNGYQRSGDIAKVDEDGNYVILGRKTDMIKINGNRIEPAEIEAAVKRVLGIDWAFAKGFVQPERSFICVYYTADIEIDNAKVREELMQILPSYMIPSYFIHLDDIPRLPNGKVNRQALLAPDIKDYVADYVAPTNELEELLCNAMRKVLGVERVGINDDFYLLGGDSLRTIRLIAECHIEGLTVSEVYAHRTPAKIAEAWLLSQLN